MRLIERKRAFTLVEIMIVVAIIGMLAAIAVPAFIKARNSARRNACLNNLRQIDGAKDEYAIEYGGGVGETIDWYHVSMYVKDITNKLYCPSTRGTNRTFDNCYRVNVLGTDPVCLISPGTSLNANHSLSFRSTQF